MFKYLRYTFSFLWGSTENRLSNCEKLARRKFDEEVVSTEAFMEDERVTSLRFLLAPEISDDCSKRRRKQNKRKGQKGANMMIDTSFVNSVDYKQCASG